MEKRHLPLRAYILTWVGLLALTGLTFGLSFAPLGGFDIPVALTIAALKATLVAVFFMHLYEQRGVSRLVLAVSAVFVALLVSLLAADVATRDNAGAWPPDQGSERPSKPDER
jgi:cytochrome c oxidase subunit 4